MNSEAGYWILSTMAQCIATLMGFLFVAFIFWFQGIIKWIDLPLKDMRKTIIFLFVLGIILIMLTFAIGIANLIICMDIMPSLSGFEELPKEIANRINEATTLFNVWCVVCFVSVVNKIACALWTYRYGVPRQFIEYGSFIEFLKQRNRIKRDKT